MGSAPKPDTSRMHGESPGPQPPTPEDITPPNAKLSEPFVVADGIVLRLVQEWPMGRLLEALVIDEHTTIESIHANWWRIKAFAEDIARLQGADLNHKYERNLYGLCNWRKKGIGWKRLAIMVNYLARGLMYGAYAAANGPGTSSTGSSAVGGAPIDPRFVASSAGFGLVTVFVALGLDFGDFNSRMEEAFASLDQKRLGSDVASVPFSPSRIRDHVRPLEAAIKSGKITISPTDQEWNSLEWSLYELHVRGHLPKVDSLLNRGGADEWLKNREFVQDQVKMIIEEWDRSETRVARVLHDLAKAVGKS